MANTKSTSKTNANIAKRGEVTKTYHPVNVLAGFMDDQHFGGFAQEHLSELTKAKQQALFKKVETARTNVSVLTPVNYSDVEIRPLKAENYKKIVNNKEFKDIFGRLPYRFVWIKPEKLVALQVFVNSQQEDVPSSEKELVKYALPENWSIPSEISFIPPLGPISIVSSSPQLAGLEVKLNGKKGEVIIKPPTHINLIQIVQYGNRYYLRNGYHRTVGAISAGCKELPALVVDATQPAEVELANLGLAGFSVVHSAGLARPPLVSDFCGNGSIDIPMREKRYGASVSLQISPINIGV